MQSIPANLPRRLLTGLLTLALCGLNAVARAQPAPDQSSLQALWPRLATTHWVAEGAAQPEHLLYVFFDPNCGYCHQFWLAMQARYMHEHVAVRYILLGIISETSPAKAAAILSASRPELALRENELRWNRNPAAGKGGGIVPLRRLDFSMLLTLRQHEHLADAFGLVGTPELVWKDRQGQVHLLQGAPTADDLARIIASASAG